ncbi:MAG: hypothetical protein AB1631_34275, partial [Acidobacteriota bacterium]
MTLSRTSHVKYPVDVEVFLREDALSFYLLGVFLSDGNIEKISGNKSGLYRVGISSCDADWLEMIRDTLSPNRPIWKRKDQEVRRMEISNQEIAQWLLKWGCHERKSLTGVTQSRQIKYHQGFQNLFVENNHENPDDLLHHSSQLQKLK